MHEFLQHFLNGIISGSVLALPALGLTLMFSVLGFANFAFAAHATLGAVAGYLVNVTLGWPVPACLVVAVLAAGAAGIVSDAVALRGLRRMRRIDAAMMVAIASIALNMALESAVRFFFGNDHHSFDLPLMRDVTIEGFQVSQQQAINLGYAVSMLLLLFGFFGFTRAGKAMRAVADNPDLARLKGISAEKVALAVTFVGMGLAGAGGMLLALETSVDPLVGSRILLMVFAASVVGGLTSIPGAVAGALLIGVAQELSLLVISPTYSSAVGFIAIAFTLTLRPQGLFGRKG
jgi:branched-chain amino acid transport system permease protein